MRSEAIPAIGSKGRFGRRMRCVRAGFSHIVTLSGAAFLILSVLCALAPLAATAQELGRKKLPGLSKIESTGPTKGVFTGGVQTMDSRSKVLEVSSADGANSAIFPITKKVRVSSIEGHKLKLAALTPGTNVIVHYQQQGGRRTVQEIIVLTKAPPSGKKGHSPS
ncbi:MAG: hypothetical protein ACRD18_09075 [Terriglobia bacterium]